MHRAPCRWSSEFGLDGEILVVVADALAGIALIEADPMNLQKRA